MRPFRVVAIPAVMTLLAACNTGGLGTTPDSPFAPPPDPGQEAVDGLIVGHRLMDAGEHELALDAYYRAANTYGLTPAVLSSIGSANLALGRLGQAEKQLRQAIKADPDFPEAWNNLGVVLMEKGEYGEASRVFQLAFALDSGRSAEIRHNLSLALAKRGDPDYSAPEENFRLVRRGPGFFQLLATPESPEEG